MESPRSRHYMFESLVSANDLSQSWVAKRRDGNIKCFVKVVNPISRLDKATLNEFLLRSFKAQTSIRSPLIITADRKRIEDGEIRIEYPLIDTSRWKPLTAADLMKRSSELLPQLAFLIDYLHVRRLVHGDIKLDNFNRVMRVF